MHRTARREPLSDGLLALECVTGAQTSHGLRRFQDDRGTRPYQQRTKAHGLDQQWYWHKSGLGVRVRRKKLTVQYGSWCMVGFIESLQNIFGRSATGRPRSIWSNNRARRTR